MKIREVDKVEILTLQDNYIDVTALDNSAIIQRANPLKDMQIKNSILAEHGFSALVTRPRRGQRVIPALRLRVFRGRGSPERRPAGCRYRLRQGHGVVTRAFGPHRGYSYVQFAHGGEQERARVRLSPRGLHEAPVPEVRRGDQGLLPRVHKEYRAQGGVHPQGDHRSLPASGRPGPVSRRDPPAYRFREGVPHRPPRGRQARKSGMQSRTTPASR